MPERVHRLGVARGDEARARGGIDLPADGAGRSAAAPASTATHSAAHACPTSGGAICLAVVEQVPDALQVAAVAVPGDPEVDVQELPATGLERARAAVSDLLLGTRVHGRAMVASPRVAEPAPLDLLVHDRRDLDLRQPGPEGAAHGVEDLLGRPDRLADPLDLAGRLPSPERADDPLGRDEPLRVRRVGERLLGGSARARA